MKKIIVALTLFVGFAIAAQAQTDTKSPQFKFSSETHDFGKILVNKPVTYDFKYENIGEEPLIITKADASCGCTVPKYTTTPIKKGETGVISVTYSAAGAPSSFSKTVTIMSNAKTPVKVLYIKGETVKELTEAVSK